MAVICYNVKRFLTSFPKIVSSSYQTSYKPYHVASYTVSKSKNNKVICQQHEKNPCPRRSFWECFPYWSLANLHEKDKLMRENCQLVYRNPVFNYMFYGQCISMSVLAIQLYSTAVMIYSSIYGIPFSLGSSFGPYSLKFDILSYGILSFFTFQTFIVYYIAQSTPLRVYFNEQTNEYVTVFLGVNPFQSRHVICKPGGLEELKESKLGMILGHYKLNNRRIVLNSHLFGSMEHYNRMIGRVY